MSQAKVLRNPPGGSRRELVKIAFDREKEDGGGRETMWGERVTDSGVRILNIPVLVFGVAYHDVFATKLEDGVMVSAGPILRSGHSTYRLMLSPEAVGRVFDDRWARLEAIGCWYEKGTERLIAVDVPPETDIYEAYRLFEEGMKDGVWTFDEGFCGHPPRDPPEPR